MPKPTGKLVTDLLQRRSFSGAGRKAWCPLQPSSGADTNVLLLCWLVGCLWVAQAMKALRNRDDDSSMKISIYDCEGMSGHRALGLIKPTNQADL